MAVAETVFHECNPPEHMRAVFSKREAFSQTKLAEVGLTPMCMLAS